MLWRRFEQWLMALEVKNAPGQAGYALLVFDRDIDADLLRLAILNRISRSYLGQSVGKPNWTPARSHFFQATLVSRKNGETVFKVGPEVTTFIPDELTVEVTSEDNTISEVAVWSGILLDFHWKGPDIVADTDAGRRREDEEKRSREREQQKLDEARKAEAERNRPVVVQLAPTPTPPAPLSALQQPVAVKGGREALWAICAVIVVLSAAIAWASQNRDMLCAHFGMFCDAETNAFRAAQACAAPRTCGANECIADYRKTYPNGRFKAQIDELVAFKGGNCVDREMDVYKAALACATRLTCGANSCIADYRRQFPDGRFKNSIDQIAAVKGSACDDKEAYDRAASCAASKTCGANECIADYRRRFPNGSFKAEIDRIAAAKGARCQTDLDREAYDRAVSCSALISCGADLCLSEYRRDFPNGNFKPQVDQISSAKGAACRPASSPLPTLSQTPAPTAAPSLPPLTPSTNEYTGVTCSKPNLEPIEEMICADGDLGHANGELQRAFDAKRRSLTGSQQGRDALANSERTWLQERDRDCKIPSRGPWSETDLRTLKSCFIEKTNARRNELR